jgi:hypothetical protein
MAEVTETPEARTTEAWTTRDFVAFETAFEVTTAPRVWRSESALERRERGGHQLPPRAEKRPRAANKR